MSRVRLVALALAALLPCLGMQAPPTAPAPIANADAPLPGTSGADFLAGGAGNDEIFGQLGDDAIQGDGSIDLVSTGVRPDGSAVLDGRTRVGAYRDADAGGRRQPGPYLRGPSPARPTPGTRCAVVGHLNPRRR